MRIYKHNNDNICVDLRDIYPFIQIEAVADLNVTNPYLFAFLDPFIRTCVLNENPSLKLEAGIDEGKKNVKLQITEYINNAKNDDFLGLEKTPQQEDGVIKELNALIPDSLRVARDVLVNFPK